MSIRYTKLTKGILSYIDEYGFITIQQCARVFFKGNKQPMIQAQKKLKIMFENEMIKRTIFNFTGEYIYTIQNKSPSFHRMCLMNLYSYIYSKNEIIYFKIEEKWNVSKKRNDAHIIFKNSNGIMIGILIEVDVNHTTSKSKLDALFNSMEIQEWYYEKYKEEYYPTVIIVNSSGKTSLKSDQYDVLCFDFKLTEIDDFF